MRLSTWVLIVAVVIMAFVSAMARNPASAGAAGRRPQVAAAGGDSGFRRDSTRDSTLRDTTRRDTLPDSLHKAPHKRPRHPRKPN